MLPAAMSRTGFRLSRKWRLVSSASGGQGALFEKTAPWTPAKTFD
jgi:hypothetical protein